jgi:hypothetical protein
MLLLEENAFSLRFIVQYTNIGNNLKHNIAVVVAKEPIRIATFLIGGRHHSPALPPSSVHTGYSAHTSHTGSSVRGTSSRTRNGCSR